MTIREAARLQRFPGDIRFRGGDEAVRLQIGNAVPPLLAQHLGFALREHLEQNGVAFQNYEAPERTLVPESQRDWYLRFEQDALFKEMLRRRKLLLSRTEPAQDREPMSHA